jgi:protein tyrosine/serine phosphatase
VLSRHLDWGGCFNTRDLGGLLTREGRSTQRGAVVRSDAVDRLSAAGWAALVDHGVRTIIDLRNSDERGPDAAPRPSLLVTLHLPLDGVEDREFWDVWQNGPQFGTPLYYRPHLDRFAGRSAMVLAAIARAHDGGVLFHCQGGRDRAGQIAMLLLALVGVSADHIADDYGLSESRLRAAYAARGEQDQGPLLAAYLAERGTTARDVLLRTLRELDIESHLRAAGLTSGDVDLLRARLIERSSSDSRTTD